MWKYWRYTSKGRNDFEMVPMILKHTKKNVAHIMVYLNNILSKRRDRKTHKRVNYGNGQNLGNEKVTGSFSRLKISTLKVETP